MRRILYPLIFVSLAILASWYLLREASQDQSEKPTNLPPIFASRQTEDIQFNNEKFEVAWVKASNISLHSNLKDAKAAKKILEESHCKAIVNGGFYTKENTHIGLLVSEGKMISQAQTNQTFNGFFFEENSRMQMSSFLPESTTRFALQSGPILIQNEEVQKLKIKNDAAKRRMVVARTPSEDILFMAVYSKNSPYQGPYLEDLPETLLLIQEKLNIKFTDALNLDGGTASALLSEHHTLDELSPIGSYFCVN